MCRLDWGRRHRQSWPKIAIVIGESGLHGDGVGAVLFCLAGDYLVWRGASMIGEIESDQVRVRFLGRDKDGYG